MKHIRKYTDFLNEKEFFGGGGIDPRVAAMNDYMEGVNDIHAQISELKQSVKDKPEENGVVTAKIRVLQAKLMVVKAQREVEREQLELAKWKENEKLRKAAEKEAEKEAKAAEKERAAKMKAREQARNKD
jgi:hypothetical protein